MRTTKTFAVAVIVSTLLTAPVFAAPSKTKQARTQDEQPLIIRVMNRVKHFLEIPIVTQPSESPIVTQPSEIPIVTQPH